MITAGKAAFLLLFSKKTRAFLCSFTKLFYQRIVEMKSMNFKKTIPFATMKSQTKVAEAAKKKERRN